MKKTINVTQDDIDNGNVGDACACPVALALRRAFKTGGYDFYVEDKCMFVNNYAYFNPPEVKNFIVNFDHGIKVEPFSFELES
jgi:hypothetical protein